MMKQPSLRFEFAVVMLAAAWILLGAIREFYQIAWGTGVWLGQFAVTWFLAFVLFSLFCILWLFCIAVLLWRPQTFERLFSWLEMLRAKIGFLRWFIAAFLCLVPVYILQYTFWGIV